MSTVEQSYRSRVNTAYYKLCKSHLVTRKDTSERSLTFFEEWLNKAMPQNAAEKDQMRIIKDLYYNAPRLTYQVITAERDGLSKQSLYVLWTNAWCITRHFDIENLVYLEWDVTENAYKVRVPVQDESNNKKPFKANTQKKTKEESSEEWQTVNKKKYRTRKGKKNERRLPKSNPAQNLEPESTSPEPVNTPITIQTEQSVFDQVYKKGDPWE